MTTPGNTPPRFRRIIVIALIALGFVTRLFAQATGTIEGRITNPSTGGVVERAHITIEGTTLEAFTDADGHYRLGGVPAGAVQVRAFFSGFPPVTASVNVAPGQAVQRDFEMSPTTSTASAPKAGETIKLDEFVVAVSREMSGAAMAINEQRFAPNMKNVLSTDEFGDIAEGNAAEFLKFMPGVNIDYAGGNGRDVSLNGVPSIYVPVTLDGFGLASAVGGGAGGTSRGVGLDQVSINNLSRIEVAYSPTPDSQANALAGSVNLVPRSSFERTKPQGNYSAYLMLRDDIKHWGRTPAPRHPTHKIHPGLDVSYVAPVTKNFGFTLSAGINRQYSGEPQIQNTWRAVQAPTNANFVATTPDKPYLTGVLVRNSGKDTKRSSFGLTTDYRFSANDRVALSLTYSTFDVHINHNELTFDVGRVTAGNFSLSETRGAPGAGTLNLETTGAARSNWTFMPSILWRHDGPMWKMESGFAYSRASNRNRNVEDGFFATTTSRRTNLTINYSDIFYLRPNVITVTDAAGAPVNPYSLDSYVVTATTQNTRATDDYKRTAYANVKRDFFGRVPVSLKAGLDFRDSIRDQRISNPGYTYVGRDGTASTTLTPTSDDRSSPFLDPSFSERQPSYGFPKYQGISSELLYNHFVANPTYFTPNANAAYTSAFNNSKVAHELISAGYVRGDLQFLRNRLKLVTGLRAEQTNIDAEGPLVDPSRNILRDAQGRPILVNGRTQPIVPSTNALGVSQLIRVDRGAKAEKEYLRLFPSVNVSYNLRENLTTRVAWYTSIGRPDFNQYAGGVSLPDPENPTPNDQITINNPVGIKPWESKTLNARLEYYPAGVGQLSIAAFRRDFKNFFGSTTVPATPEFLEQYSLDPDIYGQYPIVTQYNIASTVRMQGINVDYRQSLTFLPRWARGVQVFANFAAQRLMGPQGSGNFPGFIPKTINWGASLSRERFRLRANWNYRSLQRRAAIANGQSIEPGTFTYWSKRLYMDVNAEYSLTRRLSLYAAIRNIGDATDDIKIYGPSTPAVARFRERIDYGSLWSFGVKGTF